MRGKPFRLDRGDIHTTFWAPRMIGGTVWGRLTHRPTRCFVDFEVTRHGNYMAGAIDRLTKLVRQGRAA